MAMQAHELVTDAPRLSLGEWLRKARKDARMEQVDLAAAISVSQRTVSNWENNKGCPDVRQYRAIAQVTGARWLLNLDSQNWKVLRVVPDAGQLELGLGIERPVLALA